MGILRLKNDQKTTNPPHANQLVVGELAINAVTGKIYTKLVDGSIVEFIGRTVCYNKIPTIKFDDISKFCCSSDIIYVKVSDLLSDGEYEFELEDISNNGISYTISPASYSTYSYTPEGSTSPISLMEALIPINISITGIKNLTILKFKIMGKNNDINTEITSKTITLSCQKC